MRNAGRAPPASPSAALGERCAPAQGDAAASPTPPSAPQFPPAPQLPGTGKGHITQLRQHNAPFPSPGGHPRPSQSSPGAPAPRWQSSPKGGHPKWGLSSASSRFCPISPGVGSPPQHPISLPSSPAFYPLRYKNKKSQAGCSSELIFKMQNHGRVFHTPPPAPPRLLVLQ